MVSATGGDIGHGDRFVVPTAGGRWAQFRHVTDGSAVDGGFHDTRNAAVGEARRLARREGVSVFVLEWVGKKEYRLRRLER